MTGRRISFNRLLEAICQQHEVDSKALVQAGQQRRRVAVRAQLVYLVQEWSELTTKYLGRGSNGMRR